MPWPLDQVESVKSYIDLGKKFHVCFAAHWRVIPAKRKPYQATYRIMMNQSVSHRLGRQIAGRWKTNIQPIEGALGKVERLHGVSYDWKESRKHDLGFIAEEVGEVLPEIVTYEETVKDATSMDYARLTALLVEAVKDQQAQIRELKAEMSS